MLNPLVIIINRIWGCASRCEITATATATPFFFLCFASGARMILGPDSEKNNTLPYVHVHTVHVCCDILWFNHEVLVLGARQQHTGSSHTMHCDLRSARNCASSLQPRSGHGSCLHVQYAACVFLVFLLSFFFLSFFRNPSFLLAG